MTHKYVCDKKGWEHKFSSVAKLCPTLCNPWTAACQAFLSFTISWSLLKFMSIELMMPSNHLILCHSLLLLPSIFPSIRVFSNELALCIRWPKYWTFSFSISPSNEYSELISPFYKWGNWGTEDLGILVKSHSQWEAEIYFEVLFFFFPDVFEMLLCVEFDVET